MANNLQAAKAQAMNWLDVPRATALIVLGALVLLVLIHRGFRGVNIKLG